MIVLAALLGMGADALDAAEAPILGYDTPSTPLHLAISEGCVESVKLLVAMARKRSIWVLTPTGQTAVEYVEACAPAVVKGAILLALQPSPKSAVG